MIGRLLCRLGFHALVLRKVTAPNIGYRLACDLCPAGAS